MARHSRSGQMVFWWKSRNATRERPFGPEESLRRYKSGSLKSFLDTEVNRERGDGEGEVIRIPNWLPGQSSKLAEFETPREGRDSEIDHCLAWV
jgi:hypothetical protein